MPLTDDLSGLQKPLLRRGPKCRLALTIQAMSHDESAILYEKLRDRRIPSSDIARVLMQHGHDISAQTVTRHRRGRLNGGCACHEEAL